MVFLSHTHGCLKAIFEKSAEAGWNLVVNWLNWLLPPLSHRLKPVADGEPAEAG